MLDTAGHLHGVLPIGQCITSGDINVRDASMGALSRLTDELLLEIVGRLPARDLVRLSAASRAAYVFSNDEDLWRALTMQVRFWQDAFPEYVSNFKRILATANQKARIECLMKRTWKRAVISLSTHGQNTAARCPIWLCRNSSKRLVLQELEGAFQFQASWKDTYIHMMQLDRLGQRPEQEGVRQEARVKVDPSCMVIATAATCCAQPRSSLHRMCTYLQHRRRSQKCSRQPPRPQTIRQVHAHIGRHCKLIQCILPYL